MPWGSAVRRWGAAAALCASAVLAGQEPPPPRDVFRRGFASRRRASGTLHGRFEVWGTKTGAPVKAGFAVVREDGTMLAASPATPLGAARDGTLSRAFGILLDGVAAGRCELVVVAEDEATGERTEAREAFVVSRPEDLE